MRGFFKVNEIVELIESKDLLVFDFDGVLADSVEVKTKACHQLYAPYGQDVVDKVIKHHRENGGMSRFDKFRHYHNVFLNQKISEKDILALSKLFSDIVMNKVISSPEIKGAYLFLNKYCKGNKSCIVNSATPQSEIIEIIKRRSMFDYFSAIYGSPSTKIENLSKALINNNNSSAIFFGDAKSDVEAANEIGIDFIGIGQKITEIMDSFDIEYFVAENFEELL